MYFSLSYVIVLSAVLWPSLAALSDECSTSSSSLEVGGEGVWLHCSPTTTIIGGFTCSCNFDQIWESGQFPTLVDASPTYVPPKGKVL